MDDRSAKINIGGREFELILTTRATKEIAGRYGGLENLGQKHYGFAVKELVKRVKLVYLRVLFVKVVFVKVVIRGSVALNTVKVVVAVFLAHVVVGSFTLTLASIAEKSVT